MRKYDSILNIYHKLIKYMIELTNAYAFIGGAFVGRFGGIIPAVIVSGVILYVVDPSVYNSSTLMEYKTVLSELVKNITNS